MENKEIILKPETKCYVELSVEDSGFSAVFKGYSSLCGEVAMVFDCNGKLRFVPLTQIVYIDQTEAPCSEDQPKKIDIYYR